METADKSISLAKLQIAATVAVVASFLASTIIAAVHARSIDRDVGDIVGEALPTVVHLSAARGELHRIDTEVDAYVDEVVRRGVAEPPPLDDFRDSLERSLSAYAALPAAGRDHFLYEPVRDAVTDTERAAARTLSAALARDIPGALDELASEHRAAQDASEAMRGLADRSAAEAREHVLRIGATRGSTARIAFALDGVAVALAFVATALALSMMRRTVTGAQRARAVAERRSEELDRFAGRVAHDILGPLSTVVLALELVGRRIRSDPASQTATARAHRGVQRVRRLVEDLLILARAAARPDRGAVADLGHVSHEVVEDVREEATRRGISIELGPLRDLDVACTAGVLTSILGNLVRNAVQYIGDATPRAVAIRGGATGDRVRVEVEDTGPGVPSDMQAAIFEPFVRGNAGASQPGSGIGLATVKQLVVAHGGSVGCRSNEGAGCIFWFELPRAPRASVLVHPRSSV